MNQDALQLANEHYRDPVWWHGLASIVAGWGLIFAAIFIFAYVVPQAMKRADAAQRQELRAPRAERRRKK